MWAAKERPEDLPKKPAGNALTRMITREIASCKRLQDLEDVCNESSSSFDFIHTTAALIKYARLSKQLRAKNLQLLKRLINLWQQLMPDADVQACTNVLWVFGSVGLREQQVWDRTWAEYIKHMQRNPVVPAQEISSALWACGKLRQQPAPDELQLLLQAFLQPAVLDTAAPQALSNVALALTQLRQLDSRKAQVSEEQLLLLLGDTQLAVLAVNGTPQAVSNVLIALARLATGDAPVLSIERAHHCAKQLLPAAIRSVSDGQATPQSMTNTVWAVGQLRMPSSDSQLVQLVDAVVRAAPRWCPASGVLDIAQVLEACVQLNYRNEALMQQMLQRSQQLVQQQSARSPGMSVALASTAIYAATQLNLPQFIPATLEVLKSSGVGARAKLYPADSLRLWMSHTWLLQHGLCGGNGLSGIVSKESLLQGQQLAAKRESGPNP
jgi:hypothetical protein